MAASEAQKRAVAKYKAEHYKRVALEVRKEDYGRIKEAAEAAGESVNKFIKSAIDMRINGRR